MAGTVSRIRLPERRAMRVTIGVKTSKPFSSSSRHAGTRALTRVRSRITNHSTGSSADGSILLDELSKSGDIST